MIKELNKELGRIAEFDHEKKEDTLGVIQIALKVLSLLLAIRMKLPFKKAANKAKWERWVELIENGTVLSNIIIKP